MFNGLHEVERYEWEFQFNSNIFSIACCSGVGIRKIQWKSFLNWKCSQKVLQYSVTLIGLILK